MVDLAIVVAIAAGAFAGWQRGFIVPLVIQAGALLSLAALYAGPLNGVVPSGFAGLGMGAAALVLGSSILGAIGGAFTSLVYRIGVLKRFDKAVGIPLGAATAAVSLYVALVGLVALDGWLAPLHGKLAIAPADIVAIEQIAAANPSLGVFADPTTLEAVAQAAAKAPIPSVELSQHAAALGIYEDKVRPQLLSSRLAPLLLSLGAQLPLIGRHVELPAK